MSTGKGAKSYVRGWTSQVEACARTRRGQMPNGASRSDRTNRNQPHTNLRSPVRVAPPRQPEVAPGVLLLVPKQGGEKNKKQTTSRADDATGAKSAQLLRRLRHVPFRLSFASWCDHERDQGERESDSRGCCGRTANHAQNKRKHKCVGKQRAVHERMPPLFLADGSEEKHSLCLSLRFNKRAKKTD